VDLERRVERADRDVEADLVVAGARAPVRDGLGADRLGHLDGLLGLDDPLGAHRHRVDAAAQAVALDEVGDESVVDGLARVDGAVVSHAELPRAGRDLLDLAGPEAARVDADRDHLRARRLAQPDGAERGVESAREGEH
jgi:hypothetical protein